MLCLYTCIGIDEGYPCYRMIVGKVGEYDEDKWHDTFCSKLEDNGCEWGIDTTLEDADGNYYKLVPLEG